MSTVQVSRTTSTVEVSATRPRVEVGTPSVVAHNDLDGRTSADAHPIGAITGLLPLPSADGSRWSVSHAGGAVAPAWSNKAAWRDQTNEFTQTQRFAAGTPTEPSVAIGSATYGFGLDGTAVVMTISGVPRLRFAGTLNTQDNYGNYTTFSIRRANGTYAAPTKVLNGDTLGLLMFRGAYDVAGAGTFDGVGPYIRSYASEDYNSATTRGAYLALFAIPNGSSSATECLRVDGSTVYAYKPLALSEAANISAGTTTGSKIGTATAQKLGFWNATPVIQPAAAAQAAASAQVQATLIDSTGGTASTTLASITAGATYLQADLTAIKNAIASLAARLAEVKTDVANVKTLEDAIRTALVNTGLIKGAA